MVMVMVMVMVMMPMMVVMAVPMVVAGVLGVGMGMGRLAQWAAPGWAALRGASGSAGKVKVRKSRVGALSPPRR